MKKEQLTYEQIIEQLTRIANGDSFNDLESLVASIGYLQSEAELLLIEKNKIGISK